MNIPTLAVLVIVTGKTIPACKQVDVRQATHFLTRSDVHPIHYSPSEADYQRAREVIVAQRSDFAQVVFPPEGCSEDDARRWVSEQLAQFGEVVTINLPSHTPHASA